MRFLVKYCREGELSPRFANTDHSDGYVVYEENSNTEWMVYGLQAEAIWAASDLNALVEGRHQVRLCYDEAGSIQPLHYTIEDTNNGEQTGFHGTLREAAEEARRRNG